MLLLLRPVSLQSPSCPGTTYLDQDAMELIEISPISAFLLLGLKVYYHAWQEPCILKETLKKKSPNDVIFSIKYPCVYALLSTCEYQIRLLKLWGELK